MEAGTKLGRYMIRHRIGSGGMGEVYLVEDTKLRRHVALKILPQSVASDKDRLLRFEREAFAASALNHPNILTIFEFGKKGETHFLASEYVDGETLSERIERGVITVPETLDIAAQIASALHAAHTAGIVHRDIKPENVMIRKDGYIKVLDFGLAKLSESSGTTSESSIGAEAKTQMHLQTQTGIVMGTAAYMSPEQARGRPVDVRTDIFSFGVLLYEMLTQKQPFTGETINHTIVAILEKEPTPISQFVKGYPSELEKIINKMLRKNHTERYQTAKELLSELKALQKRLEFEAELERTSLPPNKNVEAKTQIIKEETVVQDESQNSIAVLPFSNITADPDNDYFCDGLAEELSNALGKIKGLKVAARTSAFSFKNKNLEVSEIGSALNVKTILEGSVRKSGKRVRITVQLANVSDGYHLWSERYDREMRDILDVQDEITLAVVDALKVKLLGKVKSAMLKRYTDNTKAYELYLKGCFYRGKGGTESRKKAVEYFQDAIAADPNYALAYAELSFGYRVLVSSGSLDPQEFSPKVEAMALKALELDEDLAEAHFAMACFKQDAWKWRDAESSFKRAIGLNPNLPKAYVGYAGYLSRVGRAVEAIKKVKRARELDPLSPIINANVGFILYFARHHDEAIETLKRTLELDSNFAFAHLYLGYNYAAKGMFTEAVREYKEAIRLGQNTPSNQVYLGASYAGKGEVKQARAILKQLLTSKSYVSPGELTVLYAALGEREKAFASLEKAFELHDLQLQYLGVDPAFDSLRDDPRFQELLRKVGLPK